MRISESRWIVILAALTSAVFALSVWLGPAPAVALPDYAAKTGQACGVCHVNPAGGGPLTPRGTAFAAIPNHAADPAGAFAQSAAQPTATPTAPAVPAATPTAAPPAPSPTPAPTKPAATPTPTPTPGALPRAGGFPVAPLAVGSGAFLAALGWSLRRVIKR